MPRLKDEGEFKRMSRRELLKMSPLVLAGVTAVPKWRDSMLTRGLRFSDWASAKWFRPGHPAPTFADREVAPLERFPFNSYGDDDPDVDFDAWTLEAAGLVKKPAEYKLADIQALPKFTQNTRHICVEGWDVIGNFGGARISDFLHAVGADTTAKFLNFECADDYYECLDMATALHPQSLLCYEMYGKPLERGHGAPLRLSLPTKIGYKSAKYVTKLEVTNVVQSYGYWEDQGYDWFYGL